MFVIDLFGKIKYRMMENFDLVDYINSEMYYECDVCRHSYEDMLCCYCCLCNVCENCKVSPDGGDCFCSITCLANNNDETLHTCSVCDDHDVLSIHVVVCLTCERKACMDCAEQVGMGYVCSKDCRSIDD